MLSEGTLRRHYVSANVDRIPIREGRVRGTLFMPRDRQDIPAGVPLVVTLYGGVLKGGKVIEEKAALLASKGKRSRYDFLAFSFLYQSKT